MAQSIASAMSISTDYPNPTPSLAVFNTAVQDYLAALADAQTRDKVKIGIKNDRRAALESLMVQLGKCVNFLANGDRTKLLTSGYELSKEPGIVTISKPENIQLIDGLNSGELILKVDRGLGVVSFVHEYCTNITDPTPKWVSVTTTTSKCVFKGFGKRG